MSLLSDASVSALMDTVNCVIEVSLALEFPGENVELEGLEVKFAWMSADLLSRTFEIASEQLVSQKEDDRTGASSVNEEVGEVAGREEDEIGFGDIKDPDNEEFPPDDLLLETAVAGNLVWNGDVNERFVVSDFSSLRVFEEVVADGIPNEGGVIGKEGGIGDWIGPKGALEVKVFVERCDKSFWLILTSTPGVDNRNDAASWAQEL